MPRRQNVPFDIPINYELPGPQGDRGERGPVGLLGPEMKLDLKVVEPEEECAAPFTAANLFRLLSRANPVVWTPPVVEELHQLLALPPYELQWLGDVWQLSDDQLDRLPLRLQPLIRERERLELVRFVKRGG